MITATCLALKLTPMGQYPWERLLELLIVRVRPCRGVFDRRGVQVHCAPSRSAGDIGGEPRDRVRHVVISTGRMVDRVLAAPPHPPFEAEDRDGDPVLVWKAPTWEMNPTVDRRGTEKAYAEDAAVAAAEYGAEFRAVAPLPTLLGAARS
jgi:hypothetical protein